MGLVSLNLRDEPNSETKLQSKKGLNSALGCFDGEDVHASRNTRARSEQGPTCFKYGFGMFSRRLNTMTGIPVQNNSDKRQEQGVLVNPSWTPEGTRLLECVFTVLCDAFPANDGLQAIDLLHSGN